MDTSGKERLREMVRTLGLDDVQRALIERAIATMSDEEAAEHAEELASSQSDLQKAVVEVEALLNDLFAKNDKPRS
jgi:hypothetical protein